jgi:hypothetical protein
LSGKHWKLVITSLSGGAVLREVAVAGDNWLSALRAARSALGEEGAVPPGASCVMSATGEVTILDAAQRLRYTLARIEEAAAVPAAAARPEVAAAASAAVPALKRAATVAYSPEEAAAARTGLGAPQRVAAGAQSAQAARPASEPPRGFSPSRPSSLPPLGTPVRAPEVGRLPGTKRQNTVAYSPEESAQVRKALDEARAAPTTALGGSTPISGTAPTDPAPARPSAPQPATLGIPQPLLPLDPPRGGAEPATRSPFPVQGGAALPPVVVPALSGPHAEPRPSTQPAAALAPPTAAAPGAPLERAMRKQTMAYSPEESAEARAQLLAAQAALASNSQALPPPRSPQELFGAKPAILVTLSRRDEEPNPSSPLTYRERSYFGPPSAKRAEVESALRNELDGLRRALAGQPRGQYVNLAVFDHAFHERPERPPVATLQWKDRRGEPTLSWAGSAEAEQWRAMPPEEPVKASVFPDSTSMTSSIPPATELARPGTAAAGPQAVPPKAQPSDPFFPPPAGAGKAAPVPAREPNPAPARIVAPRQAQALPQAQVSAPFFASPTPHGVRDGNGTGDQDKRLAIAFEASQDLYFMSTPVEGLDFAVKLLQELVPSEALSACLYDINTDEFRFVAVVGVGAEERRAVAVPSTLGLFCATVRSGLDSLVVKDVAAEPRYDPVSDGRTGLAPRNMAFLPLHKADHLLGMLQLINRRDPRGFSEGDLAVASYVAHQVTEFLRAKRGLG